MASHLPVIVIRGGQAGLSISYYLKERGIKHLVFERNRIAEAWRSERWDSFCLVTPNWQIEFGLAPNYTILKGAEYPVTYTVPLAVALGDSKFYNGDTYGYFCTGLTVSTPLAFIPKQYGSWNASAGYKYYNLGDQAAAVNSVSKDQNVFDLSIGCTF